jgi:tight adherence protein B
MRQAGLPWSRYTYWVISVLVGLLTYLVTLSLAQIGLLPALGFGMTAGLLLPHLYVSHRRISRFNRFGLEFPNALDIIVRGVTAGLPLVDCLKIVATEAQEPVATEFRGIIHDQTMGVPLDEAVERLAKRIPLSEASFFAIVIAIQSRTGGSLSEALGNLSKVLRDRKNLKGKVTALSAEAKSSAGIIGAMPLVVALILYFTAPDYVMLLFTTTTGKIVVGGSVLWMLVGTLMMRKMINFDF